MPAHSSLADPVLCVRAGGPDEWVLFSDEIGDTRVLHGKIAVMVLARMRDVRSGSFSIRQGTVNRVAAGVRKEARRHRSLK